MIYDDEEEAPDDFEDGQDTLPGLTPVSVTDERKAFLKRYYGVDLDGQAAAMKRTCPICEGMGGHEVYGLCRPCKGTGLVKP